MAIEGAVEPKRTKKKGLEWGNKNAGRLLY